MLMRRRQPRRWRLLALVTWGCATTTTPPGSADLGGPTDAVVDLSAPVCAPGSTLRDTCRGDAACDDGCFCNGIERCLGGQCVRGEEPCEDGVECTLSACDEASRRCLAPALDDARCDDGEPCNGTEACTPAGCVSGEALACDDGDVCTVDACQQGVGCTSARFDDPCTGQPECRPPELCCPTREICDNGLDDDCNGDADIADIACPTTNDACATALHLPGPGEYLFSTRAARDDLRTGCERPGDPDVFFRFELTETSDITASLLGVVGAIELRGPGPVESCGNDVAAGRDYLGCADNRFRVDFLPAGTYWLAVATPIEGLGALTLDIVSSPDRTCVPRGLPASGGRVLGDLRGDDRDPPSCSGAALAPDSCFSLSLSEPRAVRVRLRSLSLPIVPTALELVSGTATACHVAERTVGLLVGHVPAGDAELVAEPTRAGGSTRFVLDVDVLDLGVCDRCDDPCLLASGDRAVLDAGTLVSNRAGIDCGGAATGPDAYFAFDTTVPNERVDLELDVPVDFSFAVASSPACPLVAPAVCESVSAGAPVVRRVIVATPGRHVLALKAVSGATGDLTVRVAPTGLSVP